jgi:hypothetical protein
MGAARWRDGNFSQPGQQVRSRMRTNSGRIFLSASAEKAGHQLLDHECWVLGRDVLSSAGNMLCEFGFRQVRCPNGGLTQYELRNALGEDAHVYLWGFGVFFGDEREGVFLGRNDFRPRRTLGRVELHRKEDPDFVDETCRLDLFLRGIAWFADYEQWISHRMPEGYRELCLATFPRKALPGGEFAERWRALADCIEEDQHTWDRVMTTAESARDNFPPSGRHH